MKKIISMTLLMTVSFSTFAQNINPEQSIGSFAQERQTTPEFIDSLLRLDNTAASIQNWAKSVKVITGSDQYAQPSTLDLRHEFAVLLQCYRRIAQTTGGKRPIIYSIMFTSDARKGFIDAGGRCSSRVHSGNTSCTFEVGPRATVQSCYDYLTLNADIL